MIRGAQQPHGIRSIRPENVVANNGMACDFCCDNAFSPLDCKRCVGTLAG
jgi:hypothetical protein